MADRTARRVALLSIHPRHADSILAGRKHVELRRIPVAANTTHVIVYATSPVKAVIGWFEVGGIDEDSRTAIWNAHGGASGVSRREFRDYFAGADRAFAIRIASAHRLRRPLPLDCLPGVKRPPQSFQYLDAAAIQWVLAEATTPGGALALT